MNKLRLNVDSLAVESFPTARTAESLGTVHGAEDDAFDTRTSCGNGGYPPCTCPPPAA
jgi:hypothetical protein